MERILIVLKQLSVSTLLTQIVLLLQLLSCMESIAPKKAVDVASIMPTYSGCIEGAGIDISKVFIKYEYPSWASEVYVYRDGEEVFKYNKDRGSDENYFIDSDLLEGHKYVYQCKALYSYVDKRNDQQEKIITGNNSLELTTNSINKPKFQGIKSVTKLSAHKVNVAWYTPENEGAEVSSFQIFKKLGESLDMDQVAVLKTVSFNTFSTTIDNLGDELTYSFGVRACSAGDVCSDNTNIKTVLMSDGGAPTTLGLTKAEVISGKVVLTMPWEEINGAVERRIIYRSTSSDINVLTSDSSRIRILSTASYELGPEQTYYDTTMEENTTYYYLVRDADQRNLNTNENIIEVKVGDLRPPEFPAGLISVADGTSADTDIKLEWKAIDPTDASHYIVYLKSETTTPNGQIPQPSNPCVDGVEKFTEFSSSGYTQGTIYTYNLTGLNPRTTYRVCLKARDSSGNVSVTDVSLVHTTKDITSPVFDGVQKVEYVNGEVKVSWNKNLVSPTDLKTYKVNIWADDVGTVTSRELSATAYESSYTFGKTVFNYHDDQKIYIVVQACDDAAPNFSKKQAPDTPENNCSNFPFIAGAVTTKMLQLGDTTKPVFVNGVKSVELGSPADRTLIIKWDAIESQTNGAFDSKKVNEYRIYRTQAAYGATLDDPCTLGTVVGSPVSAEGKNPPAEVTYPLYGNVERTNYGICVKAVDAAGNISETSNSLSKLTEDVTPPSFDGLKNFEFKNGKMIVEWTPSSSSDISKYCLRFWKGEETEPDLASTSQKCTFLHSTYPTGRLEFDNSSNIYSYGDNEKIHLVMDACDNASPLYSSKQNGNCTNTSLLNARVVPLSDTTPPGFSGITDAKRGSPADTNIELFWTAVVNQEGNPPTSPNGVYQYKFYYVSQPGTVAPTADPCGNDGTYRGYVYSSDYIAGNTVSKVLTGFEERTYYKFCIKAFDKVGNPSVTTETKSVMTYDVTPPSFGGITSAGTIGSVVNVYWVGSGDSDLKSYKIKIWKDGATPYYIPDIDPSNTTGYSFTPRDFGYGDNDVLNLLAVACDNAKDGGYNTDYNCQDFDSIPANKIVQVTLPDITPPPSFDGIKPQVDVPVEGQAIVYWPAPGNWSDYAGFKVYTVNATNTAITEVKDCPCVDSDCETNNLLSCTVTGLDNYREYKFFVRAYDRRITPDHNYTDAVAPFTPKATKRTIDTHAPTFPSGHGLLPVFNTTTSSIDLSWYAASDNQYNGGGNVITYKIFMKDNADFVDRTNPQAEGVEKTSTTLLKHSILLTSLTQGHTYYFSVCAFDSYGLTQYVANPNTVTNKICSTTSSSKTVVDNVAPVINSLTIGSLVRGITSTWNLSWDVQDNIALDEFITVSVYRKFTNSKTDFPTATVTYKLGNFTGVQTLDQTSADDGESNTYVTYRVVIKDQYGFSDEETKYARIAPLLSMQGNYASSQYNTKVAVDSDSSLYVAGNTDSAIGSNCPTNCGATYDLYVIKYDKYGNVVWKSQVGGSSGDFIGALNLDNDNNPYIVGYTTGALPGKTFVGGADAFIIKFNKTDGATAWITQYGTANNEYFNDITFDSSNNIWVTGYNNLNAGDILFANYNSSTGAIIGSINTIVSGTADNAYKIIIDKTADDKFIAGKLGSSAVVYKYNSSNSLLWTYSYSYDGCTDYFFDLALDENGDIFAAGVYLAADNYINPLYIHKINGTTGTPIWSKTISDIFMQGASMQLGIDGEVILLYGKMANFGASPYYMKILSYDPTNGNLLPKSYTAITTPSPIVINGSIVDKNNGRIYASGYVYESGYLRALNGMYDFLILEFSKDLDFADPR